jgi:hypothetical protein
MHESEQQVIDQPTAGSRAAQARTEPETRRRHTPAGRDAVAAAGQGAAPGSGDLTDELLRSDQWTDEMLQAAGIPVTDMPLVSVGGGIGSFVTVDYLRIAGVTTDRIAILSNLDYPWQTYEYLTRVSQIPKPERIRSDSASRPDNIWGFPSYALAEAIGDRTLAPLWQVLIEPIFADYYTPKAGRVFAGLEREAKRIDYPRMLVKGQVRMIRKRRGGGYFIILTPMVGSTPTKRLAYRAEFIHLAIGYPGLRFLPELQEFRTAQQDFHHVVSAYEEHEHIYEAARTKHLVVMLRGGGIVASRVLQRLMDDRAKHGLSTDIVHLFRTYITTSHGPNAWNRRKGAHGFAYQGFNYPKSVWGGQLKARMRKLEGEDRGKAYKLMGGTNTPYRRRWQSQMKAGREAGWYRTMAGTVEEMRLDQGMIVSCVKTQAGMVEVAADFVIDCTGLEADIAEHRVLADLLEHSGVGRNPLGRLDVERTFELRGASSGPGVVYASGATTLGGYFPGVDTFLGLQVAAQEIADDLARRGFCRRIGTFRSIRQWLRWARNKQP